MNISKSIFLIILLHSVLDFQVSLSQELNYKSIANSADSLYNTKNHEKAAKYYIELMKISDFRMQKARSSYNAACCYALSGKLDSALFYLSNAIENGYNSKSKILSDPDLKPLHNEKEWIKLKNKLSNSTLINQDPSKSGFYTEDIDRFWQAFDIAKNNELNKLEIYKKYYFNKSTDGMADYMSAKVESINYFVKHIEEHPKLYNSIRDNTLRIDEFKNQCKQDFYKLKELYPDSIFPDIYFFVGAFTSGGTVSNSGLLIAINQVAADQYSDLSELSENDKLKMNSLSSLRGIIAHELIHFQQRNLNQDTITLAYAIIEGMADFLGEMISGTLPNANIYKKAEGKEKEIWEKFKVDMYYNRYDNWIANYDSVSENQIPDLGYWIGYQICKSYFINSVDKKKAINDMLNIKDYRKFLKDSKWEERLKNL